MRIATLVPVTVHQIGELPWTHEQIVDSIDEFERCYSLRPLRHNAGGMAAPHMFATWFIARHLKPHVVIESGVWRGQSTWLFEQACPDAEIHAIDLNLSRREYISSRARYHNVDFTEIDWSGIAGSEALVFFDDHQNAYNRLIHAHWFGFEHLIFEDNDPPSYGDCYSLKKAFAGAGFGNISNDDPSRRYRRFSSRLIRKLGVMAQHYGAKELTVIPQYTRDRVAPNRIDATLLEERLHTYVEFPPPFDTGLAEPTPPSLLEQTSSERAPQLYAERASYHWICYARLHPNR